MPWLPPHSRPEPCRASFSQGACSAHPAHMVLTHCNSTNWCGRSLWMVTFAWSRRMFGSDAAHGCSTSIVASTTRAYVATTAGIGSADEIMP